MDYTKHLDEVSKYSLRNSEVPITNCPEDIDRLTYAEIFDLFSSKFKIDIFIEYNIFQDLYFSRAINKEDSDSENWSSKLSDRYKESRSAFRDAVVMAVGLVNSR